MSVRKSANGHANGNPVTTDADWWRQATVYQIYPRSFADENGDGMGDLKGITARVPYLKELGIDAVWLSPFYPSALKDGGYDVADYRDVDPKIGTLEDFDAMAAALKAAGIKTIVDIVPNHSSDDHVWFQEALKSPKGSKERERYIFRDGKGADKSEPPNDWRCLFGGSAWDPVGDGQFYLHLFDSSQPDFNWDNREVKDDFLKTLRFWADRGVSGFRVDVAHGCAKDMSEPFASQAELDKLQAKNLVPGAPRDAHPFWDRSKVHEIFAEWRGVFNEYEPPLTAVAEAWVAPDKKHLYASSEGLGQSFSFDMLVCAYQAPVMKELIDNSLKDARSSGSSTTWVLSNHDVIRHATRYGLEGSRRIQDNTDPQGMKYCNEFLVSGGKGLEPELGLKRARAATLMMLALPGSTYLYQGEELGLPEVVDMPAKDRQDPIFIRSQGKEIGRDGCRVPIPWSTSAGSNDSFGFSPDGTKKPPHLPMPEWMGQYSVEALDKDEKSTLNLYRRALKLKKELRSDKDEIEWATQDGYKDGFLHFKRPGGWEVLFNVDKKDGVDVPEGEVLVASGDLENGKVPINTTIWLKN